MKQRLDYIDEMKGFAILTQTFVSPSDLHEMLVIDTTMLISTTMPSLPVWIPRF